MSFSSQKLCQEGFYFHDRLICLFQESKNDINAFFFSRPPPFFYFNALQRGNYGLSRCFFSFSLCVYIMCFNASGCRENFATGTVKLELNGGTSSSGGWSPGSLLVVPGGAFIINKHSHTVWIHVWCASYLIKHLQSSFFNHDFESSGRGKKHCYTGCNSGTDTVIFCMFLCKDIYFFKEHIFLNVFTELF